MINKYLFADESGCLNFKRGHNISKYFILCSIVTNDLSLSVEILSLRKRLVTEKLELGDYFHATRDKQVVRDAFFETIRDHDFKIQATIMEKSKARPDVKVNNPTFYRHAWFYHLKHGLNGVISPEHKSLITAASLGTNKEKAAFKKALDDSISSSKIVTDWHSDFPSCASDPCLQVADYCAWAIARKWETDGKDTRSYDIISDKISYEHDLWKDGATHYYD